MPQNSSGTSRLVVCLVVAFAIAGCGGESPRSAPASSGSARPSVLLVTLDTTRADAIGPDATRARTPSFNALAARGRLFRHAYATAPETLPSHASILTGLYPAGHGIHENARFLSASHSLLAERLQGAHYRTAAFVSSFVLARRFGLARGFEVYDDETGAGRVERRASETTDRAIAYLARGFDRPLFLWVHYFDPHAPYAPPEPFAGRYRDAPYYGEIAAMDQELGRLIAAFEQDAPGPAAVVVAGDHGEGLGDHGESQHGNLIYQSTMRVPLALAGPGVARGTSDAPVSARRIFHTILDWAGLDTSDSLLLRQEDEIVLGEAMKPFLGYGWQPQIMAIDGRYKTILAGTLEVYDIVEDPTETRNLGTGSGAVSPQARKLLDDYPVPSPGSAGSAARLTDEARRRLASLGYVSASAAPAISKDAPRPAGMTHLFAILEKASALFVEERYAEVIPLLRKILAEDPGNLDATLRLATAHSSLGQDALAEAAFEKAAAIAPQSRDVRLYLALHHARGKGWRQAVPILESIVAEAPERLPAVEALAGIRERQGRIAEAVTLRQRVYTLRDPTAGELLRLGQLAMSAQQTPAAIDAFERARAHQRGSFAHDLELGVLYLAARRFEDARAALDRVPSSHPEYPMALFKRAQASVLLNEPDRAARIDAARRGADATTRELIAKETLFQGSR